MRHGSLFSGIGAFDLAAHWLEWTNEFHCEIETYKQEVLRYYWPKAKSYEDIEQTEFTIWRGKLDILSGGFPCQDISIAGGKKGLEGNRSGLYYQFLRAIDETRVPIAVWENVSEIRKYLEEIIETLSQIGYCLSWHTIHAEWFGLPHKRERVFGVCFDTNRFRWSEINDACRNIEKEIYETSWREFSRAACRKIRFENYTEFLRMDNGLSKELVKNEIEGYGNAVVPAIAYCIFKGIKESKIL